MLMYFVHQLKTSDRRGGGGGGGGSFRGMGEKTDYRQGGLIETATH